MRHQLSLLSYSWRILGPGTILRHSIAWLGDAEARNVDSGFDERHGTETNTGVTPAEAGLPAERRTGATMYIPTMDGDLAHMLDALGWAPADIARATFVDLGSGKGRAVLLAAQRAFREVVGVELSPALHAVAERNVGIMAHGLRAPVRLVLGDAATFDVPDGPVIVYLYHPFREPVAELVVDRLCASLARAPRPAAILYNHPTLARPLDPAVFARGDVFRKHAEGARRTRSFAIGWSVWTTGERPR
jgi:SAM-dependent methyltransferase